MTMIDALKTALDWAVTHPQEAASYLVVLLTIYQAVRERMRLREAILLVASVLKDESKMPGGAFTPATIAKVEQVAEVVGAGATAVAEVKQAIADVNAASAASSSSPGAPVSDIRIGSYKGKPVYLGQVTAIGSRLGAALGVLRSVIRR